MQWESWSAFWSMDGNGFFVWGSYGLFFALILLELTVLRSRHKKELNSSNLGE